ncbi:hypothetical protein C8J55DRAFT_561388 [Lentinula edodes]|uniref:HECT domain-containing protein n=1 Tax=Lentinula lateritia TaxID=40482 RepID=A0A9W9A9U5_9AGAR|nr:hypothetical protein C8J55DRAFT_561388 [Lentinula edodes]
MANDGGQKRTYILRGQAMVPLTIATLKLAEKLASIEETVTVEDPALHFTLLGYDIELKPSGKDIAVTTTNVQEYIQLILEAILGSRSALESNAFRDGYSKVFPIGSVRYDDKRNDPWRIIQTFILI